MSAAPHTLVLDVGKTNVKLLVMDEGSIVDVEKLDNRSLESPPYLHLDTERIWGWLLETTAAFARRYDIRAIVPTTHGCTAAVVAEDGLALPVADYEAEPSDEAAAAFDEVVPPFVETLAPKLPGGQNAGRHLFWLQRDFPEAFSQARWLLPYPQYWSWRLSGVPASEITSIGCHSHLWNPRAGTYSSRARAQRWEQLFPPFENAWKVLGSPTPEVAGVMGLDPQQVSVYNGIHDSNSAYSLYLRGHPEPFSLVSTGTWIVTFNARLALDRLQEGRDTLAFVNVMNEPLPAGRWMGGREFDMLTRGLSARGCTEADVRRVIDKGSFLLPAFAPGGPFMGREGCEVGPALESDGEIFARATLYADLVTSTSAGLLEVSGDLIIDGGFVNNEWFCRLLATLSNGARCYTNPQTQGTAVGAGMLPYWERDDLTWPLTIEPVARFEYPALAAYGSAWQAAVEDG